MRKLVLFAAVITAMLASVSCGKKIGSASSSVTESIVTETSETETDTETSASESTAPVTVRPTERVREIENTDDFKYEVIEGHAVITRYIGSAEEVVVPSSIEDVPVAEIGFYAFEAQHDIKSVVLPDTITLIGEGAFMDCSSLESINLPDSLSGIDRGAFVSCVKLQELVIPSACKYIKEEAFTACESMTSLVIKNPDLKYENWGIEDLPDLVISAPENSAVSTWAAEMGKI